MADLYPEIEARMTEFGERQRHERLLRRRYDRFRDRFSWLPRPARVLIWRIRWLPRMARERLRRRSDG